MTQNIKQKSVSEKKKKEIRDEMQQQQNELQVCLENIDKMLNARGIKSRISQNTEEINDRRYFQVKATNDFVIVFCNDKKPDVDNMMNETKNVSKQHVKMCVISSDTEIKKSLKKKIILQYGLQIQVFNMRQLQYDPTDNIMQPKPSVLTKVEEEKLLKFLGATKDELPQMLIDDPIAQYFDAKPGQIIRYTYPDNYFHRVVKNLTKEKTQQKQQSDIDEDQ